MMNLREKDDAWAAAFGGFMGGSVLGLPCELFSPTIAHFPSICLAC
jgi:hypothetical protein